MMKKKGQSPKKNGIYVYCVIRGDPPSSQDEVRSFGEIGFGGKEVYTLAYRDLFAVVSEAPLKEYNMDNEEEIEIHQNVVNTIMREKAVIPVAYGMVFKNRKLVLASMKVAYKAVKKALKIVDDKVELGIKLIVPPGEKDLEASDLCVKEFEEMLGEIVSDSKQLKLFSNRLLMNTAYLVERKKMEVFSDMVEELSRKYESFKVHYSGPWPAYNFVDIRILSNKGGTR
ncbi:GvpL/GvpF family gas vesicle protein [Methanosarcina sp. Mfa9]|uniref:GvpL/GvpF family gas vesicle protein n=1 Tax=Methanosarcina sp. Mfa9 TaxID=3439063 RepID=UPI003F87F809